MYRVAETFLLKGGETVLELGTGSGYAAAVYTVERYAQLATSAADTPVNSLGRSIAGAIGNMRYEIVSRPRSRCCQKYSSLFDASEEIAHGFFPAFLSAGLELCADCRIFCSVGTLFSGGAFSLKVLM
jgi:hypothetical protein